MPDYPDYDDASEYDDSIYEDNYAGDFGVYDALYDEEEADYVARDIVEYPEFNFDDERPMTEFIPFSEFFHLTDEDGNVMMTYQALGEMAQMTGKLLVFWEKRAAAYHLEEQDPAPVGVEVGDDYPSLIFGGLNLYQLEVELRDGLRSYSVMKLELLLGGKEEVMKLRQIVDNISNFVKRIIVASVGNSLPRPMPYPVINTILSFLLPVRGAVNIGLLATTDDSKEGERNDMIGLHLLMAKVFDLVKMIMFNIETYSVVLDPSSLKEMLVEKFESLVARVTSTEFQISFEWLDIKDSGGE